MENTKTCLNRLLKKCRNCIIDYDTAHHPNNLDCPMYHPMTIKIFEVKEKNSKSKSTKDK